MILCSQKWKHFVSRTTHLVTTTQYDGGYTLLLRHKEGIEDTSPVLYFGQAVQPISDIAHAEAPPSPANHEGWIWSCQDILSIQYCLFVCRSAANMRTCQSVYGYILPSMD